ncbi:MAG TPA: FGGY family carbohydrate kinase, partial [Candidatus Limnocylindria bacterium]
MGLVLGLDVSTTATKAVLVDGDGVVRGIGQSAYGLSTPKPLWSEQDPADWWSGAAAAIRTVLAETGARADEVEGIGLAGQMHGAVLLDASDEVLRPAILWNDQRTA